MRSLFFLLLTCISLLQLSAQCISGKFSSLKGQTIYLYGFSGFSAFIIDSSKVSELGTFVLKYSASDQGIGYISSSDNKTYLIILEGDSIELNGKALSSPESIVVQKGIENKAFALYAMEHAKREQALGAWKYLERIYQADNFFSEKKEMRGVISQEINSLQRQDDNFLSGLPKSTFLSWYLPTRKFLSAIPTVAQYNTEEIPAMVYAFRGIDYADSRLYKSGLLKDILEAHFWLLENRGLPLDSVFSEMNTSIDCILKSVVFNEKLYNDVVSYLFDYFEKHSLFNASEYMAIKALSQKMASLSLRLTSKLESYRTMKKGNIAPEINFSGDIIKNGSAVNNAHRLSEISSKYKVVVFGASWCSACSEEMSQLLTLYDKWRAKDFEVLFVSLDTDPNAFKAYTSVMPFISFCDYKQWDTQAAKDYFIFASPSIFLLDSQNRILLRSSYIKAVDTWIDYQKDF